ncbi:hypothetical protein KKF84_21945 [Myxococcota bacterium]|nr:hypothetical protein [Myxococcota bacterium]
MKHLVPVTLLSLWLFTPGHARGNSVESTYCGDVMYQSTFTVDEPVCVFGDIDYTCPQGYVNLPGGYLYVVPHGAAPFSGVYIDLYSVGLGYAGDFYDVQVMTPPLTPGDYDLVIDEHCDGVFNTDDVRHDCAFRVVGDPPSLTCAETPDGGYSPEDPGISSGSLCRGTCGGDCHENACTTHSETSTCNYDPSSNYHLTCTYSTMECGSHAGCREHDDCYDACATAGESWECWRGCDLECISNFGVINCGRWAFGHGPYDSQIQYASGTGSTMGEGSCSGTGACTW